MGRGRVAARKYRNSRRGEQHAAAGWPKCTILDVAVGCRVHEANRCGSRPRCGTKVPEFKTRRAARRCRLAEMHHLGYGPRIANRAGRWSFGPVVGHLARSAAIGPHISDANNKRPRGTGRGVYFFSVLRNPNYGVGAAIGGGASASGAAAGGGPTFSGVDVELSTPPQPATATAIIVTAAKHNSCFFIGTSRCVKDYRHWSASTTKPSFMAPKCRNVVPSISVRTPCTEPSAKQNCTTPGCSLSN